MVNPAADRAGGDRTRPAGTGVGARGRRGPGEGEAPGAPAGRRSAAGSHW